MTTETQAEAGVLHAEAGDAPAQHVAAHDQVPPGHPAPSEPFVQRLASKLGIYANAMAVYTPPVERDGLTIIPVAKVRWGFGGGEGRSGEDEAGSGGGGGVAVAPVGYIIIRHDDAEFRPIKTWGVEEALASALVTITGGIVAVIILRSLRRLLRG